MTNVTGKYETPFWYYSTRDLYWNLSSSEDKLLSANHNPVDVPDTCLPWRCGPCTEDDTVWLHTLQICSRNRYTTVHVYKRALLFGNSFLLLWILARFLLLHSKATVNEPSSVVHKRPVRNASFLGNWLGFNDKFGRKLSFQHIPVTVFTKLNFLNIFCTNLFVFVDIGPSGKKPFQLLSPLKVQNRSTPPKFMYIPTGAFSRKLVKSLSNFKFWIFCHFIFHFVNMGQCRSFFFTWDILKTDKLQNEKNQNLGLGAKYLVYTFQNPGIWVAYFVYIGYFWVFHFPGQCQIIRYISDFPCIPKTAGCRGNRPNFRLQAVRT